MKNILNVGVMIILFQSNGWLRNPDNKAKMSEYFILLFSTLIGMYFMISSGDFLMFYLGLELATIPMAALAAYTHHQTRSAEAGIKLILSSALSSGILLFGLSMIYGTTGSIYFDKVGEVFSNSPLQILAFIFFFTGMAFKISLVPFHLWTADVYEGSPVNVTSYFSVISKGAASFIFIIVLFTVFHSISYVWKDIIYLISILTMTVGNLFAMRQKNMKRFLAFSSIAQAGFILLGILGGNVTGMFSLAGIPPVAGFFGKFFLFTAAASGGYYWLVFIAVLNATVSLYYYLLVVKAMFINKNETPLAYFKSDFLTRVGLLLCMFGIFILGFWSQIYEMINSLSIGITF